MGIYMHLRNHIRDLIMAGMGPSRAGRLLDITERGA